MNNKNKILVGCLALLLALSVGYALFNQSVLITGTATAKGEFGITTTCTAGISSELIDMGMASSADEMQGGFKNDACIVEDNSITAAAELMYPTAKRWFTIKMTNNNSIPAIIWGSDSTGVYESLNFDNSINYSIKNNETGSVILSGTGQRINGHNYNIINGMIPIILDSEGNLNSESNIIYDENKKMAGIKLDTGDSAYMILEFNYEDGLESVLTDNGKSEHIEIVLNHQFKWEQYVGESSHQPGDYGDYCFAGC